MIPTVSSRQAAQIITALQQEVARSERLAQAEQIRKSIRGESDQPELSEDSYLYGDDGYDPDKHSAWGE